eukprot:NODE_271_length_12205_cov_0.703205.p2 type:complete len:374 gc:universal NODE_271_length_12205_cov_0.703205:10751-9630(-)
MISFIKKSVLNAFDKYRSTIEDFAIDNGLYTDSFIRILLKFNQDMQIQTPEEELDSKKEFLKKLKSESVYSSPQPSIFPLTYSPYFFELCLGDWFKFSCCYFNDTWDSCLDSTRLDTSIDLSTAEENMMELFCDRAGIEDGMAILDLSAGYGSFSLYVAQKYPNSRITAITEVPRQEKWIHEKMKLLGIDNIVCVTASFHEVMKTYGVGFEKKFDRIMAIDILRYTLNWNHVLAQLMLFLNDESNYGDGYLFVQDSCHIKVPSMNENKSFVERHFSAGSLTISSDIPDMINEVNVVEKWLINGKHYQETARRWLINFDCNKKEIIRILEKESGDVQSAIATYNRWRIYFLTISETYGYKEGKEWMIAQYLISK